MVNNTWTKERSTTTRDIAGNNFSCFERKLPDSAFRSSRPKLCNSVFGEAITAMAHRLARLVYRMLKYGQQYVDKGTEYYDQRYRWQQLQLLRKKAARLGLQVVEAQAV